jgi:hypothetical protein
MKKVNLTVIATIIATLFIAMFAFQPAKTEASNNVSPTATPSPRNIKKMPRQQIEVENDETHLTRKSGTKTKINKSADNTIQRTRKTNNNSTRTNSGKRNKPDVKKNNGFLDAPKLDADSGLEFVAGNRNTNKKRTINTPKGQRNSAKRIRKP